MKNILRVPLLLLPLTLASCGIITAPLSLPSAVAENASFTFKGSVVDNDGKPLDGVVARLHNVHHLWTPLKGSTDVYDNLLRRIDRDFIFEVRGSEFELTFSKDGYYDSVYSFDAGREEEVRTRWGRWKNDKDFLVVLLPMRPEDADLVKFSKSIEYRDYPIADSISLNNLATNGRTGDILFSGKDAEDPTVFPPGTLYLTLGKEPPPAINPKGDIDPADLDIPHHVTLHIPGAQSGFVRINPETGFEPMATRDLAPPEGYVHEFTISRSRLRQMRAATRDDVSDACEYFFFRAGNRVGKGRFYWESVSGPPAFTFDLYLQPEPGSLNLTMHKPGKR
jgi:hypothetical protein